LGKPTGPKPQCLPRKLPLQLKLHKKYQTDVGDLMVPAADGYFLAIRSMQ